MEVSIICITYNHEKFIRKTINGFLKQKTNFPYEIIIHDDLSTDKTRDILLEYQKNYPEKIKLLLEDENQFSKGVRIIWALGFSEASGKYIAISDGDDEWIYDGKLQEQYDLLEQNQDISLCIHNAIRYDFQTGEKFDQISGLESGIMCDKEIILEQCGRAPTTSMFFRASYTFGIPEFSFRAPVGDDPLRLYFASKGKIFYINKSWAIRNYMHEGSWNFRMQDIDFRLDYIKKYLIYLDEFNRYSQKRFDEYLQEKIYGMCLWAVHLLFPEILYKDAVTEVLARLDRETESRFSAVLEKIYIDELYRCKDYLDEPIKDFISRCKKEDGKLYLYGAGEMAGRIAEKLDYMGILYEGFIVSDGHKIYETYQTHEVWSISELNIDPPKVFLWICVNKENVRQIFPVINKLGYKNILYEDI